LKTHTQGVVLFLLFTKKRKQMKKTFFLWLFIAAAFFANSQGSTLYRVNIVKPKAGMKSAFEASWKLHLENFHKNSDKRNVYEVTSGPENGSYVIVEGPISYADMDKTLPNAKEHGLDLEKNFSPKLEPGSINFIARWADTLSYNGNTAAEKFLLNITVVKDGKMGGYLTEIRRTALIFAKLNSPFSYNALVKQQAGSSPTIISIRHLKDGFKELEADYFKLPPTGFRDAYVKDYGQEAWDKRLKLLVDDRVSQEQHFEKLRADLSSPK
jgi:hypothetical protein